MKYSIVKVNLKNGKEFFVIQKHTRLFWIGPKIWESYQNIYDGNYSSHAGWTWFTKWGDYFSNLEDAQNRLSEIRETGRNSKIIKTNVIVSYE